MPASGDVVTLEFRGARHHAPPGGRRLQRDLPRHRPDIIVGVLTTNLPAATTPTDVVIEDWQSAGLRQRSAFRCYLNTVLPAEVRVIGRLSYRDWDGVQQCLGRALATPERG